MSDMKMPIACSLTSVELQERRATVLRKAGQAVLEVKELENGYAYRFPSDDVWLNELAHIISLE